MIRASLVFIACLLGCVALQQKYYCVTLNCVAYTCVTKRCFSVSRSDRKRLRVNDADERCTDLGMHT